MIKQTNLKILKTKSIRLKYLTYLDMYKFLLCLGNRFQSPENIIKHNFFALK